MQVLIKCSFVDVLLVPSPLYCPFPYGDGYDDCIGSHSVEPGLCIGVSERWWPLTEPKLHRRRTIWWTI